MSAGAVACVLHRDAGACIIYDRLVAELADGAGGSQEPRPATGPLPWLFYTGNQYSRADVGLK